MAEQIRQQRVVSMNAQYEFVYYPPLGKHWVTRFIKRHPQLKTVLGKTIEASRLRETSSEILNKWFDVYEATVKEHNIQPQNIYNMDETGFSIGTLQHCKVIINKEMRRQFQAQPGRQEWVSIVECISGDNTVLPPLIIYKGETLFTSWIPSDISSDWRFSCNTRDWTSNIHELKWLRRVFEPRTREKAGGRTRMLICDGHESHITANFISH